MASSVKYVRVGPNSASIEVARRRVFDFFKTACRSIPFFKAAPPSSFNSVPPPMSEMELAKQKAQEIAARLLNNADPTKRARVENVGNGGRGFDSSDYSSQKPSGYSLGGPPQVQSSGYPGPSRRIEIPNGRVGVIIGKGGETIKYLHLQSGAKIQVTRDVDADPGSTTRGVDLMGTRDQIAKAEQLIQDVLSEAEAGGTGSSSGRMGGQSSGAEQFVMKVPNNKDIGFCQKQHKLIVRSTTGPIGVYLVSTKEQNYRDNSAKRSKLMDSLAWTSSCRVDEENQSSSPDTSTSSKAYGFQKIVLIDAGIDDESDHKVSLSDLWSSEELLYYF